MLMYINKIAFFDNYGYKQLYNSSINNESIFFSQFLQQLILFQMMKPHYDTNPGRYIINLDELQSQSCSLCFQFSLQMRKCSNSCQKNICLLCLRKRSNMRECPFCGDRLQFQNVISNNVRFRCPSQTSQCLAQLKSQRQFLIHASKCAFIKADILEQFQYKTSYKCTCGHPLLYDKQQKCYQCGLRGSSSKCSKCQINFCTVCRLLPCSKNICMNGHPLQQKTVLGYGRICDLCEIPIFSLIIRKSYSDHLCNFDICVFCCEKLSQNQRDLLQREKGEVDKGINK